MIQRIQSILLFLAGVAFFSVFSLDFATSNKPNPGVLADQVYNVQDSGILMALAIIGGIASLGAILLFRNRGLQMRVSYLSVVMAILLPIVAFLLIYNERTLEVQGLEISDGLAIYPPLIALVLAIVAGRYIKKDDKLVKSMDRLR